MGILEVRNLTKQFGTFAAVKDISFTLKEGEILGLLGPNGAGKTTTIQMLLSVLTPTAGSISYFGKNLLTHREEILDKVNFSTTYTSLPATLSVWENLTYSSYLYDIPNRKKAVDNLIEVFRLQQIAKSTLSQLSAGQLTRVNLAKSFINDPKVLLLDEPTASLDPEIAKYIRNYILERRRDHTISVIFTSHNMVEVEEVCDRILFINNGIIVADDTPDNLMKSMEKVTVRLVVDKKNEPLLIDYAKKTKHAYTVEEREYSIELKENQISDLLTYLTKNNISFYEIGIDKPSLEDYFLMIASENKNRDL